MTVRLYEPKVEKISFATRLNDASGETMRLNPANPMIAIR